MLDCIDKWRRSNCGSSVPATASVDRYLTKVLFPGHRLRRSLIARHNPNANGSACTALLIQIQAGVAPRAAIAGSCLVQPCWSMSTIQRRVTFNYGLSVQASRTGRIVQRSRGCARAATLLIDA